MCMPMAQEHIGRRSHLHKAVEEVMSQSSLPSLHQYTYLAWKKSCLVTPLMTFSRLANQKPLTRKETF